MAHGVFLPLYRVCKIHQCLSGGDGAGDGGVAGFVKGAADVELIADGDNTLLRHTAKAETGGKIAQLGSRLVTSTARKLSRAFFENFEKIMRGETSIDAGDGDTASATT